MISLDNIAVEGNKIIYDFSVSHDLAGYFTGKDFSIEYDEDVSTVPKSILAIPFVCNVLPLIWLSDSTLFLNELDQDFFESIDVFKNGYIEMYPNATFAGTLNIKNITKNKISSSNKTAMFFSGGLDSIFTLIRHYKENPRLISIWGSDIFPEESSGWENLNKQLSNIADKFSLKKTTAKSSFRIFDNEQSLTQKFDIVLNDNWWHAVQHGIGLIGHSAPIAYLHKIKTVYIASTNCPEDGLVTCASHPSIDSNVKFFGCSVVHDGFEANRQKKTELFVKFCNDNNLYIALHVCYETQDGNNCCKCEKCLRTIMEIIVENDCPTRYGFLNYKQFLRDAKLLLVPVWQQDKVGIVTKQWINVQKRLKESIQTGHKLTVWKQIKWLLKVDISNSSLIKYTFIDRLKLLRNYIKWRCLQVLCKMGFK